MSFWNAIDRFEGRLAAVGAGTALMFMVVVTVLSVVGRYWLQTDLIPGSYNMIERVFFPLIVFWAIPYAHRKGTFPRFDSVSNSLPASVQRWLQALLLAVELVIHAVLMWYIMRYTWSSIEIARTMQIGTRLWPMWPVLIMMPLAFALLILEMSHQLWRCLMGLPAQNNTQAEADVVNPIL
ncbi:TRAP transporter small permease [Alcaligenaceae bacterium]|nr:TRAP transporter small permease [Alcaligenaceae bacterium]